MATADRRPSILRWREIPGGVWALGFVSLFMDASSEMIHALLPLYLVSVLGASTLEVGVIEGIAEATAAITKMFSGVLSDWVGRRKWLAAACWHLLLSRSRGRRRGGGRSFTRHRPRTRYARRGF